MATNYLSDWSMSVGDLIGPCSCGGYRQGRVMDILENPWDRTKVMHMQLQHNLNPVHSHCHTSTSPPSLSHHLSPTPRHTHTTSHPNTSHSHHLTPTPHTHTTSHSHPHLTSTPPHRSLLASLKAWLLSGVWRRERQRSSTQTRYFKGT